MDIIANKDCIGTKVTASGEVIFKVGGSSPSTINIKKGQIFNQVRNDGDRYTINEKPNGLIEVNKKCFDIYIGDIKSSTDTSKESTETKPVDTKPTNKIQSVATVVGVGVLFGGSTYLFHKSIKWTIVAGVSGLAVGYLVDYLAQLKK